MAQQAPQVSVRTIFGASNYQGPSVSLRIVLGDTGSRQGRDYLFGVGSGIARAGLEHKCRPSRNLRATFSCTLDSSSCGGLGGLVLRLRSDGHGKVTCVGPNGVAAQLQALHNLLCWSHPKVTVSEFPDIDDGTPVYEDDAIAVFTLTKPSTPWNKPQFISSKPPNTTATDANGAVPNATAPGSSSTSSASESSSEDASGDGGSQVDDGEDNESKDVRTGLGRGEEAPSDSDEESSSDSEDDYQGACLGTVQQQQLFRRMDAVFTSGGAAKDVVSNIRSCILDNGIQSRPSLPPPAAAQQGAVREAPGGKRGLVDERAVLSHAPRRVRSRTNAAQSMHSSQPFSNADRGGVIVARYATGSIAKQSSGAYGFLVQVKGSDRCLLLSFASDVGQLQRLARHPMIPLLDGIAHIPKDHDAAAAAEAGIRKVACLHMCPQNLHTVGAFHKLLDHLPCAEHFVLEHGVLANKGFAHCASVRLQAKLNLADPAVFRLPAQLSAPPLKAVCSSVYEHKAAGTVPTAQAVLQSSAQSVAHSAVSDKPPPTASPEVPGDSKSVDADGCNTTAVESQRPAPPISSTSQAQGNIERAESACTEAEAAEVAADAAKCDLDKARAALAAVDAALAASSSSLLNDRLAAAREEADQVVKERSAAHMKALQRMRETAEAAEAACCAAEHMEAPCRPSADATAPSAPSVKALVPKPPATSPALQESSYVSLQKAGAVMLGILCELHWSDELCVANGDSGQLTSVQHSEDHAGQLYTKHGTVIKGSCLIAGAKEPGERWRPFGRNIIAERCPVDVMCVQATTLLQHPQFADALTELRHVLTCLRSFCSSVVRPPGPIFMDPFQPCLQAPCPPGPACAPVQCTSTSMPCPAVLAGQQSASLSPHAQNPLPSSSGLPQSTQQALSVLGPLPLAAACWSKTTVTFLGTGSAEPSKYRGPTALMLEVGSLPSGSGGTMLLDCGESTWETMCTMLGKDRAQACVNSLVAVWVSHKHADHCLGLPAILAARTPQRPALVLALPASVWAWISQGYPHLLDRVKYVHCSRFSSYANGGVAAGARSTGAGRDVMAAAGFTAWQCVRVRHCADAYGIVLEHSQGWKVVVSGDTEPCEQLVAAGMNATLLVHEATFSCELAGDAAAKRHSTVGQALEAAQRMGAWRVILTHFSQRYSKFAPNLQQLPFPAAARAFAVFDGARVRFTDLWFLPVISRAMEMFVTEEAEEEAEQAIEDSAQKKELATAQKKEPEASAQEAPPE